MKRRRKKRVNQTEEALLFVSSVVALCAVGLYIYGAVPVAPSSMAYGDAAEVPNFAIPAEVAASLGATVAVAGVSITPTALLEDSRCPADVQCIQAGTVRVNTHIESGLGESNMTLALGVPVTTEAESITLTSVEPIKEAAKPISQTQYLFIFEIARQ